MTANEIVLIAALVALLLAMAFFALANVVATRTMRQAISSLEEISKAYDRLLDHRP